MIDVKSLLERGFTPRAVADELMADLRNRIKLKTIRDAQIRRILEAVMALRSGPAKKEK